MLLVQTNTNLCLSRKGCLKIECKGPVQIVSNKKRLIIKSIPLEFDKKESIEFNFLPFLLVTASWFLAPMVSLLLIAFCFRKKTTVIQKDFQKKWLLQANKFGEIHCQGSGNVEIGASVLSSEFLLVSYGTTIHLTDAYFLQATVIGVHSLLVLNSFFESIDIAVDGGTVKGFQARKAILKTFNGGNCVF